ncbi:MAG: HU family DNA-binding protein [Bacteroidaceae bacterium]|nr:HU family DNA-binding protein [Bacteroidaceae bacterium]
MDAKLNQSDLSAQLARMCEMSVTKADTFTKAFFDVIIEGLESDGIVKINGLGTFKMVDVASRSSVNVNTGEKFEIKGHKKITFLPADSLKEKVNAPFAMFEPVEVDDDYVDEPDSSDEEQTDIAADTTVQAVAAENIQPADTAAQAVAEENTQPADTAAQAVAEEDTQPSDTAAQAVAEENTQPADTAAQAVAEENTQPSKGNSKTNKHRYIWLTLLIIIAAGILCWPVFTDKETPQPAETKIAVAEKIETAPADTTVVADTLCAVDAVEESLPFVLVEELAQTKLSAISIKDTVHYTVSGIMAVHRVGLDETLVKISLSYYNDKRLWPYIVQHNRLKNFNQLEIGMEIEIPRLVPHK